MRDYAIIACELRNIEQQYNNYYYGSVAIRKPHHFRCRCNRRAGSQARRILRRFIACANYFWPARLNAIDDFKCSLRELPFSAVARHRV